MLRTTAVCLFVMCFFLTLQAEQMATAKVKPKKYVVLPGVHNVAVFRCLSDKPIKRFHWTHDGKRLNKSDPNLHQQKISTAKVNATTVKLSILNPTLQDGGEYCCHIEAFDRTRANSNKAILTVLAMPSGENSTVTVIRGRNETIACPSTHNETLDEPISSQYWIRVGTSKALYNSSKYTILKGKFTIYHVDDIDTGVYECATVYNLRVVRVRVPVIVAGSPYSPTLTIAYHGSRAACHHVTVRWKLSFDGNSQVKVHILECQGDDKRTDLLQQNYAFNETSGTVSGMQPRKAYVCKLKSCNALGCSEYSNNVTLRCIAEKVEDGTASPASPSLVSATPTFVEATTQASISTDVDQATKATHQTTHSTSSASNASERVYVSDSISQDSVSSSQGVIGATRGIPKVSTKEGSSNSLALGLSIPVLAVGIICLIVVIVLKKRCSTYDIGKQFDEILSSLKSNRQVEEEILQAVAEYFE